MSARKFLVANTIAVFLAFGLIAQAASAQITFPNTPGWGNPAFMIFPAKGELPNGVYTLDGKNGGPPIYSATWVTIYNPYVENCRTRIRFYDEDSNSQCVHTVQIPPDSMYTVSTADPSDFLRRTDHVCGPLTDYEGIAVVFTTDDQCADQLFVDGERIYFPGPPPPRCEGTCPETSGSGGGKNGPPPPPPFIRQLRVIDVSLNPDKVQNGD